MSRFVIAKFDTRGRVFNRRLFSLCALYSNILPRVKFSVLLQSALIVSCEEKANSFFQNRNEAFVHSKHTRFCTNQT